MAPNESTFLSEYSRFLDSHGTHLSYTALSLYRNFDEGLSEKERRFLKNHLDSCPSCSKKLAEVAEVEVDEPKVLRPSARWFSTPLYRYSLAAVLFIAIGASIAYYLTRSSEGGSTQTRLPGQSIAAASADQERFAQNPLLENYVGRTIRSGSAFTFLIPRAGDTLMVPFMFKWEGGNAGQSCTLTIVDNKNVELWKGTTTAQEEKFEKTLEPGLYYAKLETGGNLVQVGRFIVVH